MKTPLTCLLLALLVAALPRAERPQVGPAGLLAQWRADYTAALELGADEDDLAALAAAYCSMLNIEPTLTPPNP